MAQRINVVLNSIPSGCRDLAEFAFFCGVGFTFGRLGLIWHVQLFYLINNSFISSMLPYGEILKESQVQINKWINFHVQTTWIWNYIQIFITYIRRTHNGKYLVTKNKIYVINLYW